MLDRIDGVMGRAFNVATFRPQMELLIDQNPGRVGIAVDGDGDGSPVGFVIGQGTGIGPLVAADEATVASLAAFAVSLPWTAPPRLSVPPESEHLGVLESLG